MTSATVCSTPSISRQAPEKQCLFKLLIFSEDRSLCRVYSESSIGLGVLGNRRMERRASVLQNRL